MFTNGNFKLYYSDMSEEREKIIRQPKLPGLEPGGVYQALGIPKPVLVQKERVEVESKKPVSGASGPDLATIEEDREDRAAMYRR